MAQEIDKLRQHELASAEAGEWLRSQDDLLLEQDSSVGVLTLETWKSMQPGGLGPSTPGPVRWSIQACDSLTRYPTPWEVWVWTRGASWQVNVMDPREGDIRALFRSDGSWIDAEGRRGTWSGVKEGGPESVMRGILRVRRRPGPQ
jgi:hypothetical protein